MTRGIGAALLSLALVACGEPMVPHAPVGDACRPRTCAAMAFECGALDDGCGGTLDCGTCDADAPCGEVMPHVCGTHCARDADCALPDVCDLGSGHCTSGCRTGTRIAIDVPRAAVTLHVTLDGQPLPPVNDGAPWAPLLVLRASTGTVADLRANVALYAADRMPLTTQTLQLAPGRYDVTLWTYGLDPAWPAIQGAPVTTLVVGESPAALDLDIDTSLVDLTTTLASAPLPASLPSGSDGAVIDLVGEGGTRYPITLCDRAFASSTTVCHDAQRIRVMAGRYDLVYSAYRAPSDWPQNGSVRIGSVDATHDVTASIDIPRVYVTPAVTLEGAALPDYPVRYRPALLLGDVAVPLYASATSGPLHAASTPVAIVPGTYDVSFSGGGGYVDLPALAYVLETARTVAADTTLAYDLTTVAVDYDVTANGTRTDMACLSVGGSADDGSIGATHLAPGTYPLALSAGACPAPWPTPSYSGRAQVLLAPSLDVRASTHVAFDVVTSTITTAITLDGAPPAPIPFVPPDERSSFSGPDVTLVSPGGDVLRDGQWMPVYLTPEMPRAPYAIRVVRGDYDVAYFAPTDPAGTVSPWPITSATLTAARPITTDGVLAIDVPSRSVSIHAGLRDALAAPIATRADLALIRRGEAGTTASATLSLAAPAPIEVVVIPGTYELRYVGDATADGAPGGDVALGCWTVP